ncbi:MAG TPA: DNA mismatch repair endonuclease MutL [Firmicutes bacterium]|jgi:DNA mismatch repair protein MutL|nr:DNA mismatch repair endonuclease MutL [Bacillota bacterium]HBL69081.1 DNA mismatch repair endonuclease MutL [Bacillota bacterium]HBR23870.1 DNA mismatch repair endonuclease MutL [Bacillota bacterium]HCF92005.1 DNA mismatch repair endonuclease MutL [Bacillota bacterium]
MGNIRLLSEATINKIAAGEIIERPASVVKELLENSLDAGATRIEVEIRAGGRQLIRVTDNGAGMDRDDAVMALERHSTSKIRESEDLESLKTLGFRGEALASIAAVSIFKLVTVPKSGSIGTALEAKAGVIKSVQEAGAAVGTTITIRDLFFNVPARLKYMKSIPTEASYIADLIGRLAMSRPDVSFRLLHGDFEVLFTHGTGNMAEVLSAVLGKDIAKDLLEIGYEAENLRISGFIGKPEHARSNRHSQHFFVSGRTVRSPLIGAALEKAYKTLLPIARFPLAVIFMELPGTEVDVNVHPTKAEVKFSREDAIFSAVYRAVSNALRLNELIPSWKMKDDLPGTSGMPGTSGTLPQPQLQFAHSDSKSSAGYIAATSASEANAADNAAAVIVDPGPEVVDAWRSEAGVAGDNRPSEKTEVHCLEGQLDRTYLFATDGDGLILIDQHAAHERVIFDRLMQTLRPDNSQLLVIPETMELNYRQYKMASEKIPVFKSLGYDLEPFGGKTIVIRAVPVIRGISDHKPLLLDLIEQLLATERFNNPKEIQEAFLITMSCRAAVKAGDRLANLEKEQLLSDLWKTRNPYTCPHGRPTMIRLSRDELDRRFRRK